MRGSVELETALLPWTTTEAGDGGCTRADPFVVVSFWRLASSSFC